jgi:hypothetical protein
MSKRCLPSTAILYRIRQHRIHPHLVLDRDLHGASFSLACRQGLGSQPEVSRHDAGVLQRNAHGVWYTNAMCTTAIRSAIFVSKITIVNFRKTSPLWPPPWRMCADGAARRAGTTAARCATRGGRRNSACTAPSCGTRVDLLGATSSQAGPASRAPSWPGGLRDCIATAATAVSRRRPSLL